MCVYKMPEYEEYKVFDDQMAEYKVPKDKAPKDKASAYKPLKTYSAPSYGSRADDKDVKDCKEKDGTNRYDDQRKKVQRQVSKCFILTEIADFSVLK